MSSEKHDLYRKTKDFYEDHATELFQSYNAVSSPLADTVKAFLKNGETILDVGCGSGRDLKMLRDSGFDAYGMDSSVEFVRLVQEKYTELKDKIFKGTIPDALPPELEKQWDGILCTAVLQHIPDNLIFDCFFLFQRLLKTEGKLLLSIPARYPVQNDQDNRGRFFKLRSFDEYDHLLRRIGFTLLHREDKPDGLGREKVVWLQLVYRKNNQED